MLKNNDNSSKKSKKKRDKINNNENVQSHIPISTYLINLIVKMVYRKKVAKNCLSAKRKLSNL